MSCKHIVLAFTQSFDCGLLKDELVVKDSSALFIFFIQFIIDPVFCFLDSLIIFSQKLINKIVFDLLVRIDNGILDLLICADDSFFDCLVCVNSTFFLFFLLPFLLHLQHYSLFQDLPFKFPPFKSTMC